MRHLPRAARACLLASLAAVSLPAFSSNVSLTVDLLAPNTTCTGSSCPSDINLPNLGSAIGSNGWTFTQGAGTPTNYVSTFTLDNTVAKPIVCSEASGTASSYTLGPSSGTRFTATYANLPAGGLTASDLMFEFDAGTSNGANIVDTSSLSINAGVYGVMQGNSATSQVACYQINQLGDTTPMLADSSTNGDRGSMCRNPTPPISSEPSAR